MIFNHRIGETKRKIFGYHCFTISLFVICLLNCGCTNTNGPAVGGTSPFVAFSQTYLWGNESAVFDFIESGDGNLFLVGWEKTSNIESAYMMKVNPAGNQIWHKVYSSGRCLFTNIQRTHDGGYVVAGNATKNNNSLFSAWLLKFDAQGNLLWQRLYDDKSISVTSNVLELEDGSFVLRGSTQTSWGAQEGVFMIKTDPSGNQIWLKKYGVPGIFHCIYQMQLSDDNGIICTGRAQRADLSHQDIWIFKIDFDGNVLWNKYIGSINSVNAFACTKCADKNFMVAGSICDSANTIPKIWMIKINSSGEILWDRKISATIAYTIWEIKQAQDGNFIIAGSYYSTGSPYKQAVVSKLDSSGNFIWELRLDQNLDSELADVIELSSKRIVAAGILGAGGNRMSWFVGIEFDHCDQIVKTK